MADIDTPSEIKEIPYSLDELENLRQIFSMFDKDNTGHIDSSDISQLMEHIGKDPAEGTRLLQEIDPNHDGKVSFQEFVQLLGKLEARLSNQADMSNDDSVNLEIDIKEGQDMKILEFLSKQTERQLQNIKESHAKELLVVEEAQKAQFLEFSEAWDSYMAQYEETAFKSLERLKEKQILELQEFQAKALKEAKLKVKNSRELLELRKKQQVLAKQKLYDEADIIKRKADKLEEWENAKNEATIREIVEKKEAKFMQQQQLAVAAMLKRIQRDRNEQLKHREQDSERLIQRNKNVRNDLLAHQSAELKKTKDQIRRNLENSILEVRLTQSRMARD